MKRLILTLVIALSLATTVSANPEVFEKTIRSTALVYFKKGEGIQIGTGVVVDGKNRLVLTNAHVVGGEKNVLVVFPEYEKNDLIHESGHYFKNIDKISIKAKVVGIDTKRDLALVELESLPKDAKTIELADHSAKPGQTLHAIGNSGMFEGIMWRYIRGEVRLVAKREIKYDDGSHLEARVVETQMPINKGDSGGPVLNERGELIALTQGFSSTTTLVRYAIDVKEIQGFIKDQTSSKAKKKVSVVESILGN